jgi:hypothetical protein
MHRSYVFTLLFLILPSFLYAKATKTASTNRSPLETPVYNYFDEEYIKSVAASGTRYVLVGTGWSESSLGKMNVRNQEKQKRAFALSMSQLMRIEQLNGKGQLIYLTTAPISDAYRRYLYRVANQDRMSRLSNQDFEMRYRTFEKHFLKIVHFSANHRDSMSADRAEYLYTDVNAYRQAKFSKAIIDLKQDKFTANKIIGLTAHFTGPTIEKIASIRKIPYIANPSDHAHWIKKSKSRQSFRDAKVRHPRGTYEPAFSIDALVNDIYDLLQIIDTKKIILKLDQSAAGYGNRVMRFNDILEGLSESETKALIKGRFQDKEVFSDIFIKRIEEEDGGAIVEEFIDCKNYASPASIYMINGTRNVTVQYTYDQLLGGEDNMVFQGSLGPITMPPNEEGNINNMSKKIGEFLSIQGVRGNVGTDFVVCDMDEQGKNRIAYAIENNVRMTGTSYPFYTIRNFIGERHMKSIFMKSFDDITIPVINKKPIRNLLNADFYLGFLPTHELTLNISKTRGCLIHNDMFRLGKLGVTCIGENKDEVTKLYDMFVSSITKYLYNHEITINFNRKATEDDNH